MRVAHVALVIVAMTLVTGLLAGCSHHETDPGASVVATARQKALVSPSNPNDAVAWRTFLSQAILAETHNPKLHPYAFVIPAGDSADAVERRQGEAMAIHSILGHTAVPGNMLALTGPDPAKVAEVISAAFKDVPAHGAKGLTVLYVGAPEPAATAQAAVHAAGAELRVRVMQAP